MAGTANGKGGASAARGSDVTPGPRMLHAPRQLTVQLGFALYGLPPNVVQ